MEQTWNGQPFQPVPREGAPRKPFSSPEAAVFIKGLITPPKKKDRGALLTQDDLRAFADQDVQELGAATVVESTPVPALDRRVANASIPIFTRCREQHDLLYTYQLSLRKWHEELTRTYADLDKKMARNDALLEALRRKRAKPVRSLTQRGGGDCGAVLAKIGEVRDSIESIRRAIAENLRVSAEFDDEADRVAIQLYAVPLTGLAPPMAASEWETPPRRNSAVRFADSPHIREFSVVDGAYDDLHEMPPSPPRSGGARKRGQPAKTAQKNKNSA